jgi:hypothetical protein
MGETKTLNKALEGLARQVVLQSGDNSVVTIDDGRVLRLIKGQYGGWLLREKNAPEALHGMWCYKVIKKKPSQEDVEMAKEALERLKKIADSLGIKTAPRIVKLELRYRIITAKREKATDRYSVYEISPTNEEATAAAIRIEFPYKVGKRGWCANDVCRQYGKLKKLIEAEFRSNEATVVGVSVIIPIDTSEVAKTVAKLLGVDAEEAGGGEEEAEEGVGEEGGGDAEGGAKRYLVALLPGGVDEEAVADAVREALKKLGVKNPIVKVVEAEI